MKREKSAAAWVEALQSLVVRLLGLVFLMFVAIKLLKNHLLEENWPHPDASALIIACVVVLLALVLLRSTPLMQKKQFRVQVKRKQYYRVSKSMCSSQWSA